MTSVRRVAQLRIRLLLKQRLGWMSMIVGGLLVALSYVTANVSFLNPEKIFLDFSLGAIFILQILLAIYLSSQLVSEESARRTLHLLLSAGLTRRAWLVGNALGIWSALSVMNAFWFGLTAATSAIFFDTAPITIALQATWLLSVEILIVIFLTLFLSVIVRPLLALVAMLATAAFLHSLTSLQRIFTDPQSGRYVESRGVAVWLWAARLLPPFEWLDLKSFVGYVPHMSAGFMGQMTLLGFAWAILFALLTTLRFEGMDL